MHGKENILGPVSRAQPGCGFRFSPGVVPDSYRSDTVLELVGGVSVELV